MCYERCTGEDPYLAASRSSFNYNMYVGIPRSRLCRRFQPLSSLEDNCNRQCIVGVEAQDSFPYEYHFAAICAIEGLWAQDWHICNHQHLQRFLACCCVDCSTALYPFLHRSGPYLACFDQCAALQPIAVLLHPREGNDSLHHFDTAQS